MHGVYSTYSTIHTVNDMYIADKERLILKDSYISVSRSKMVWYELQSCLQTWMFVGSPQD